MVSYLLYKTFSIHEFVFLSLISPLHQSDEEPSDPSLSPPLSPCTTPLPLSAEENEEEEEEERENPRFAKPKDVLASPPLPSPRPKWQVVLPPELFSAFSVLNGIGWV